MSFYPDAVASSLTPFGFSFDGHHMIEYKFRETPTVMEFKADVSPPDVDVTLKLEVLNSASVVFDQVTLQICCISLLYTLLHEKNCRRRLRPGKT